MIRALGVVLALLVVASSAGCNVIRLQQTQIVASLRARGLASTDADVGDARLHYWSRDGRGTPVLLVHGFGGAALWQWHEVVPALEGRPLIVPDLLWFGGSSSRVPDYSIDHQVRALVALLDRLGHERVDVVGISYGGLVAYELASAHPDRVRRMVIADSPGREYTRDDYAALCRRFGVAHFGRVLVPDDAAGVRTLLELGYANPPWVPDFALWQVREVMYSRYRREQMGLLDSLLRDIETLRARPDPTAEALLIWGRDDPVFPLSIGRRLRARLGPSARLAIIDDARHAPNVERPERFNALRLEFLDAP